MARVLWQFQELASRRWKQTNPGTVLKTIYSKQSRWCWSDHHMTNVRMTVRADCADSVCSPLPLPIKALAHWLSVRVSMSLDRCPPPSFPPWLPALKIKQTFLSTDLVSLLAFEQRATGPLFRLFWLSSCTHHFASIQGAGASGLRSSVVHLDWQQQRCPIQFFTTEMCLPWLTVVCLCSWTEDLLKREHFRTCMCVCVGERERDRDREGEKEKIKRKEKEKIKFWA